MRVSFGDSVRLIGASACWGLGTVLSKSALVHFEPIDLLVVQLGASVAAVALVLALAQSRPPKPAAMWSVAGLGVLNPGLAYLLGLTGLTMTSASLATLIWALEPALIVVAARLLLGEHASGKIIGVAVAGFGGVALVAIGPVSGSFTGALLILAGVACCALYAVWTRRVVSTGSALAVVFLQTATAFGMAAIFATMSGYRPIEAMAQAPWAATSAAIVSGVLYYGLAFLLFVGALRRVSAAVAGLFINLVPVFGILAAYLMLNERLGVLEWLGAGTVLGAMTILLLEGSRQAQQEVLA
ncbi:MAG TPA: DMT family transporter [Acidimicrobiia bacterium]|nr:DMT family transporter [Acidimicrobiia bacterium]